MANGFLDADGDGVPDYIDADGGTGTGVSSDTTSGNTGSWGSQSTPQEWLTGIGAIFQGAGSLFSAIKYKPNPSGTGFVADPQSQSNQKFIGIAVVILVLIVTIIIIRKVRK